MNKYFLFLTLFFISFTPNAEAFRVSPMTYDLAPHGQNSTKTIRVENRGAKKLSIELIAEKRIIKKDGSDERMPAEDDFLIFPPQAVIEPGSVQAIKVKYIGDPEIKESVGYVVSVAQLPVDFTGEEGQSGVSVSFKFGTSVNVVPKGSKEKIKITDQKVVKDNKVKISLKNEGNKYSRMIYGKWPFTNSQGKKFELQDEKLNSAISQPLIQPNSERVIEIKLPDDFNTDGLKIDYINP